MSVHNSEKREAPLTGVPAPIYSPGVMGSQLFSIKEEQ